MRDVRGQLVAIERALDAGEYRPGQWARFVRAACAEPRQVRRALAEDVSRVSRKLHRGRSRRTWTVGVALAVEIAATLAGGGLLWLALAAGSDVLAIAALLTWVTTFEPLLKVAFGVALGVRYEYAYLAAVEPRFKMRYGTYLVASPAGRILLHLSGCVGSPLAAWVVRRLVRSRLPLTAGVASGFFWAMVAVNAGLLLAGVAGVRRVGRLRVALSSGGSAGAELRDALRSQPARA
jgi:hypothetical protein